MTINTLTASRALIASVGFLCVLTLSGCRQASSTIETPIEATVAAENDANNEHAAGPVTFEITIASEAESIIFEMAEIADGTKLETLMRSIEQVPIVIRGSGATAFVEKIGSQGTESGQGWTFKIDGEFANQGIGQTTLHPPTTIQWTYGAMPAPNQSEP